MECTSRLLLGTDTVYMYVPAESIANILQLAHVCSIHKYLL